MNHESRITKRITNHAAGGRLPDHHSMNDTWRPSSLWRPESYGKRCLLSVASAVSKFSLPASTWKALSTLRPFLGGQLRHQSSTNSWCSQCSPPKSPFKLKSLHGVPQTTFGIFQKSRRHAHVRRSPRRASSPPPTCDVGLAGLAG